MLSIVIGKPGSGKSYFAVSRIAQNLVDWANYEARHEKPFSRSLYTNLVLNVEECQKYVKAETGKDVDISFYIHHLDETFFQHEDWWEEFPEGAYIVIDEVHQYVSSATKQKNNLEKFTNYLSTHRHQKQDIVFITQHTDTIHKNILCMATDCYNVCNIKNRVLPFVNIPFSDLDVIKQSLGFRQQYANVIYGNYMSKAFKKEGTFDLPLLEKIYKLYQSHTLSTGAGEDRPDLHLSFFGALCWFGRRHILHLTFKACLAGFVVYMCYMALFIMPFTVAETVGKEIERKSTETKDKFKKDDSKEREIVPKTVSKFDNPKKNPATKTNKKSGDDVTEEASSVSKVKIDKVIDDVILYASDYIVTTAGKIRVGDYYTYEDKNYRLSSVDVVGCDVSSVFVGMSPSAFTGRSEGLGFPGNSQRGAVAPVPTQQ